MWYNRVKGGDSMTKAQTIHKLENCCRNLMKKNGHLYYIDFYKCDDDTLFHLAKDNCKVLRNLILSIKSLMED